MAVSNPIKAAIDRQAGALTQYNGSVAVIPTLFQGELKAFQVQVVDPPVFAATSATPTVISMAGITLDIVIALKPTGDNSSPAIASVLNLAFDNSANQWYVGNLDLTQVAVTNALGANASVPATIEFRFWFGGYPVLTFQQAIILAAAIDKGSVALPPTPAVSYFNRNEALSNFVTWIVPAGQVIIFNTSDITKQLALSVGDNRVPQWTLIG